MQSYIRENLKREFFVIMDDRSFIPRHNALSRKWISVRPQNCTALHRYIKMGAINVGIRIRCSPAMIHFLDAGHRWLFEHAGILHRDINLDSMMLRREGHNVYGVLNDMDLAVSVGVTSASSKQRTGTKPFMAIDLLRPDPPVHIYRHDLESMLYVLVWITSRFNNGEEITEPPLQEWAELCGMALVGEKYRFIMSLPPPRTGQFEYFGRWVVPMQTMFRDGFSSWTRHLSEVSVAGQQTSSHPHFKDETLGGLVTFDEFQAIIDTKLL